MQEIFMSMFSGATPLRKIRASLGKEKKINDVVVKTKFSAKYVGSSRAEMAL